MIDIIPILLAAQFAATVVFIAMVYKALAMIKDDLWGTRRSLNGLLQELRAARTYAVPVDDDDL